MTFVGVGRGDALVGWSGVEGWQGDGGVAEQSLGLRASRSRGR